MKDVALFDVWSIEHFVAGISIGSIAYIFNRKKFKDVPLKQNQEIYLDLLFVLFICYLWESVEHYMEIGAMGSVVEYWMHGVEFWGNRLITDPLMVCLGWLLFTKIPKIVWPARIFSVLWLFIHVFIFDHAMQLHYILS